MRPRITIRTKLAAALAVPLMALAAFAGIEVRDSIEVARETDRQADLAIATLGPGGIVGALQNERNLEALRVIGLDGAVDLAVKDSGEARADTDTSVARFRSSLDDLDPSAGDAFTPAVATVAGGLEDLRAEIDALTPTASLDQAESASAVFEEYTTLVEGLLAANARVPSEIDDASLRTGVELLGALTRLNDVEARLIRETGLASVLGDERGALEARRLTGVQEVSEQGIRDRAVGAYATSVLTVLDDAARRRYVTTLQSVANDPASIDFEALLGAVPGEDAQLRAAVDAVGGIVGERADALRSDAGQQQTMYLLAALGAVALAVVMLFLGGVWITRPLGRLAEQARDMANDRLPGAVSEILETPLGDDVRLPSVEAVPVAGGAEVARVAAALNRVQDSAIALAVEQAVLRRNIADSFVNLGRRNQNLLARQLEFISHLEAEEPDPERLEQLFRLDHLATRMRRNAESLLVLAGLDPPRQWSAPVEAGDVVRAALGEVEGFQRVQVDVAPAHVLGSAAADVSHIVAELLENALSFAPPDTAVDVRGRRTEDGYVLAIVDQGVGMQPADVERANVRLAAGESFTVAPSRYLGHYVVAQLAARHGIVVRLAPVASGGIAASVQLPLAVLAAVLPSATAVVEPVVAEPVVAEPVVAEPVVAEPVVAEPVVAEPVVADAEPVTLASGASPAVVEPPPLAPRTVPQVTPIDLAPLVPSHAPEAVPDTAEPVIALEPASVPDVAQAISDEPAPVPATALYDQDLDADALDGADGTAGAPAFDLLPKRKARRGGLALPRRAPAPSADSPSRIADAPAPPLPHRPVERVSSEEPPAPAGPPSLPRRESVTEAAALSAPPDGAPGASAPDSAGASAPTDAPNSYAFFAAFRAAADLARTDAGHDADEGVDS